VLADLAFDFRAAPRLDWSFHLLWTDNEHAENKAPVPKIATRLLDPEKDAEIVSRLSDDERGPVDLFDDPCWVERPVYTEGDRQTNDRCKSTLVRRAPSAGQLTASRSTKKKR
jgi:hypothetical protein